MDALELTHTAAVSEQGVQDPPVYAELGHLHGIVLPLYAIATLNVLCCIHNAAPVKTEVANSKET
ncbi:hypothetical protein LB507_001914 [Fusarium sp. FIESC RH6]|nr:hypothetical protein LB507_001914 [Fusarium sp. FIESC RH6]